MNNTISVNDFLPILCDCINCGKDFVFTPTGDSMKPMLNGTTDTVTLIKKPEKLKKYDVVFYRRKCDGALILHRVVKVCDNNYVMSGDNQYYFDKGVLYDDVFAVLKSFTHNSKTVSVFDFSYRVYCRYILFKKYCKCFISKIYHKLFK